MPLSKEVLLKYKGNKRVFVETGSYKGDTIQLALDCGFEKIHSMEIYLPLYLECQKRFANEPKVKIWYGDTNFNFEDMMSIIGEPCIVWADAHCSGHDSSYNSDKPYPLVEELRVIEKQLFVRNFPHTIIMDDIRFWEKDWNMPITLIKNIVSEINPFYEFTFEDGFQKDDVLVAYIPEGSPTFYRKPKDPTEGNPRALKGSGLIILENMLYYG
jgi:hypothetical protein